MSHSSHVRPSPVKTYLDQYEQLTKDPKTKPQWVSYDPMKSGYTTEPMDGANEWVLRIAVLAEDMEKAVTALAPTLIAHELTFKCVTFGARDEKGELNKKNLYAVWNGITCDLDENSDRDPRGKEICIYMRQNIYTKKSEYLPEKWKDLMLQWWLILVKAGVSLGVQSTPSGDRAIHCEMGFASPFSIASFRPYKQRHGMLYETFYNPQGALDPLLGITFYASDFVGNYCPLFESARTIYRIKNATPDNGCSIQLLSDRIQAIREKSNITVSLEKELKNMQRNLYLLPEEKLHEHQTILIETAKEFIKLGLEGRIPRDANEPNLMSLRCFKQANYFCRNLIELSEMIEKKQHEVIILKSQIMQLDEKKISTSEVEKLKIEFVNNTQHIKFYLENLTDDVHRFKIELNEEKLSEKLKEIIEELNLLKNDYLNSPDVLKEFCKIAHIEYKTEVSREEKSESKEEKIERSIPSKSLPVEVQKMIDAYPAYMQLFYRQLINLKNHSHPPLEQSSLLPNTDYIERNRLKLDWSEKIAMYQKQQFQHVKIIFLKNQKKIIENMTQNLGFFGSHSFIICGGKKRSSPKIISKIHTCITQAEEDGSWEKAFNHIDECLGNTSPEMTRKHYFWNTRSATTTDHLKNMQTAFIEFKKH